MSRAQDAADNGRLSSNTYRRLMLGCALKSCGYLAAFAQVLGGCLQRVAQGAGLHV